MPLLPPQINFALFAPQMEFTQNLGLTLQHIHIQYDGLGFIPLNELMKEETA